MAKNTKDTGSEEQKATENQASPEALQKQIEALQKQLTEKGEENEILLSSNKELQSELEATSETLKDAKIITVSIDNSKYRIVTPSVKIGGQVYKAEDLAKNKELVKKMIAAKSGAIVPFKK